MKIPNIFHFFYIKDNIDEDIKIINYFSIKSVIDIHNPTKIYFHYNKLPSGVLFDALKNKLDIKIIKTNSDIYNFNVKYILIFKTLLDYGGIYIDIHSLCLKPLNEIRKYNFFISNKLLIIGSEKNSYMAYKYIDAYINNLKINPKFGIININNNIYFNYLLNNNEYYIVNKDDHFFKKIEDYSFHKYFDIIKNAYFISFYEEINNNECKNLNQINIYNLFIKYILSYTLIKNNLDNHNIDNHNQYGLLKDIHLIIWINLDESIQRKENMLKLFDNIPFIKNYRYNAINGNNEKNIHEKYFINPNTNIYPNYTNKEYAILLSHLNCIDYFCNNQNEFNIGMICEDDLSFEFINYWKYDIGTIINNAPIDWDIIMLGYFSLNLDYKEDYNKWNNEWSALSYLVNKKNIKNKLEKIKLNNKWMCNENDIMLSDHFIFSNFNTYVYKYPYFTFPQNNDSTLHNDHLDYHKIYKACNYLVLNNIFEEYNSLFSNTI